MIDTRPENRNGYPNYWRSLRCPLCKGIIHAEPSQLQCESCNALFPVRYGFVPVMLRPELVGVPEVHKLRVGESATSKDVRFY
jgi:uncharacterized protein YbaR (Trm112 family)